jgi:hypothetical protein
MTKAREQTKDKLIEQSDLSLLTPSEIARQAAVEAAAAMKETIQGKATHLEPERSGQLSPSHTPGRRQ